MSILVDTNILLRRAQPASADHPVTLEALTNLVRARVELCIVPQVIYEFWVAATRPIEVNGLGLDISTAEQSVDALVRDFVLLKDERGIFSNWRTLVIAEAVKGKTAHDARLVAAMQRHGLTAILTFNTADFSRFSGVNVVTPPDILAVHLPSHELTGSLRSRRTF